ncbi:MAG: hypothetical protein H6815_00775 [Phycisphaeraceae bacterium]|nr:hypothetical protein [Phycisphaerales bacterium]MCB9858958.1 hypothetical protein [Phycisphaeraceae bacterium]
MRYLSASIAAVCLINCTASSQPSVFPALHMPAGLVVSPQNPSVTFTVSASFDSSLHFAFAGYDGELSFSEGMISSTGYAGTDPLFFQSTIVNTSLSVISGQLYMPGQIVPPNISNPCEFVEITFTATDFSTAHNVTISSATNAVAFYDGWFTPTATLYEPPNVNELLGTITVIPAPATVVAACAFCSLLGLQRRRSEPQTAAST